jgi:HEAT repeat protein
VLKRKAVFLPAPLPRNLEASFRDLTSERASTRASAIRDVVRHSLRSDPARERAIPQLERALKTDEVPAVRAEAAVALADIAAHEALPTLLVAVEDEDAHVRQMALSALGEIGDARATRRLERALRDSRPEVRYQAVIAFARVAKDDPAAVVGAVLGALDDEDAAIRYIGMRIAEEQLATAGSDAGSSAADPLRDERLIARAEQVVDGPDAAVAVVAALYLARLGRARGEAVVLDVVAERRETPELEDEQACVEVAGDLEMRDAIAHLERRAWGRRRVLRTLFSWGAGDRASCAWHARIALARMGHERACAEILAELGSWRRETREAAVVAAGRARLHQARAALEKLLSTSTSGDSVDAALVREALVRLGAA